MTLYDELMQAQYLENAFEDWKEYREAITNYFLTHIPCGATVAIFGAGMCNDIDIERLLEKVSEITLIVRDRSLLHRVFEHYPNADRKRIHFLEADFVGITEKEYRLFSERLVRMIQAKKEKTDISEVAEYVGLQMKALYEEALKQPVFSKEEKFDYGIAFGLHSQLNNMFPWMWEIVLHTLNVKEESVFQLAASYNNRIVERFHDEVFGILKKGMIIGFEKQRIGLKDAIEGSVQAGMDIQKRADKNQIKILDEAYVYWPFDREKEIVFDVEILTFSLFHKMNTGIHNF